MNTMCSKLIHGYETGKVKIRQDVVGETFNSSTQEAEECGSHCVQD